MRRMQLKLAQRKTLPEPLSVNRLLSVVKTVCHKRGGGLRLVPFAENGRAWRPQTQNPRNFVETWKGKRCLDGCLFTHGENAWPWRQRTRSLKSFVTLQRHQQGIMMMRNLIIARETFGIIYIYTVLYFCMQDGDGKVGFQEFAALMSDRARGPLMD